MEDMSVEEKKSIAELKHMLKDCMKEDMYEDESVFKRFLRARNHNLDAAEEMLRNHIEWRKVNNVDTILDYEGEKVIKKYGAINHLGVTREGLPVSYVDFGNMDIKGWIKSSPRKDIYKAVIKHFETGVAAMKMESSKRGITVDNWYYVVNFENFAISNATDKGGVEVVIQLIKTYEANYPERLTAAYLINASWVFSFIWSVFTPFFATATAKKIKIFGKDGWQDELLRELGPEVLPAFLGGHQTDPDGNPRCKTFINHGGKIPETYYMINNKQDFSSVPGVKRLVVSRKSTAEVKIEVSEPGSSVEWEFDVKNKDIEFSLIYKEHTNTKCEGKELLSKQRTVTMYTTESGFFRCDKPGVYILVFDNSYSWLRSKDIYYKVSIGPPIMQESV